MYFGLFLFGAYLLGEGITSHDITESIIGGAMALWALFEAIMERIKGE